MAYSATPGLSGILYHHKTDSSKVQRLKVLSGLKATSVLVAYSATPVLVVYSTTQIEFVEHLVYLLACWIVNENVLIHGFKKTL